MKINIVIYPVILHTACTPHVDNKYERDSIWKVFHNFLSYVSWASYTWCVNQYGISLNWIIIAKFQYQGKKHINWYMCYINNVLKIMKHFCSWL